MDAIGINELRGQLAHTLFNIEDIDLLQRISRYVNRIVVNQPAVECPADEDEYIEKEEVLAAIRRGLLEVKEARRTGKRLMSAQELLNEL